MTTETTPEMTTDEQAIRRLVSTWMEATKAGDTATVLKLMADDALFLVPGHAPFGKDAFRAAGEAMSSLSIEGTSEVLEVQVLGEWAWTRCRLSITMKPRDGKSITRSGDTLSILRKEPDGHWVLVRDANLLTTQTEGQVKTA